MLSCPRCVQPVQPDATRCPSCGYDILAARSAPYGAPGQVAEAPPWAPLTRSGAATAPSDDTGLMPPRGYEYPGLIPGFAEGPPQITGPPEPPRRRWGVAGAVVAGLVVVAVIAVLAASRMGHRGSASGPPATTAAGAPTDASSPPAPSSPASASAPPSRPGSASTRPATRQRAQAQASTIAGYLTASGQARHGIGAAISAIGGCTNIASAVTTLRNAADVRANIVTQLASTDVSALPNGAAAVADLRRAMQASANADRHYAAWGQAVAGCHGNAPGNADFTAAQQSDSVATAAKQRFADEWNPIAATYGLAKQSANTI